MGKLSISHVYIRYDGPKLFSCISDSGQYYISAFVEDDDAGETFIYAAVSVDRLAAVQSGNAPLHIAFSDPLNQGVWKIDGNAQCDWVQSPIPDEWLPSKDARLSFETPTQAPLDRGELLREARAIRRSIVAFELDSLSGTTEYPLGPISRVMGSLQDTVDAFGQIVTMTPSDKGRISQVVLDETQLNLYGLRAASFAFLVSTDPSNPRLLNDDVATQSFNLLETLMESSANPDELVDAVSGLHKRAASRYAELLEELDHSGSGLTMIHAESEGSVREVHMTKAQVMVSLGAVRRVIAPEEIEITVEGRLVGVNERLSSFEIHDEHLDRRYKGKADSGFESMLTGLTVGEHYRVQMIDSLIVQSLTDEEEHKYRLVGIDAIHRGI